MDRPEACQQQGLGCGRQGFLGGDGLGGSLKGRLLGGLGEGAAPGLGGQVDWGG